jgi:hypothetical protein
MNSPPIGEKFRSQLIAETYKKSRYQAKKSFLRRILQLNPCLWISQCDRDNVVNQADNLLPLWRPYRSCEGQNLEQRGGDLFKRGHFAEWLSRSNWRGFAF